MENWRVNKVFYYEVNSIKFNSKSEADEYSLKLFLTEEITKLWKKSKIFSEYSIYMDKDNKTIIVYIYREPIYDNWNVGHYGCTEPTVLDRSTTERYSSIKEFCKSYKSAIKKIIDIADSINIDNISMICNEETVNKMTNYKNMVEQIKGIMNSK